MKRKLLKRVVQWAVMLMGITFVPLNMAAQNPQLHTVSGAVVDEQGVPIVGASIIVKGAFSGVSTAADGTFGIRVQSDATLVVSCLGYTTKEVFVGNLNQVKVVLAEDATVIDDVVVIGYGSARKSDLTGAVTAISERDFAKGAIANPTTLITGKVPGVQITSTGGRAGAGNQIRIRGGSSLNASNDPLIVIDGVPVANGGIAGISDPLAALNPNDIESMTILKDASATAIYGSRAANGVIIITTKKGVVGQGLRLDFSTNNSISTIARRVNVLSADKFRNAVTEQAYLREDAVRDSYIALLDQYPGVSTDWQNQIFRTAFTTDNNIGVTGNIAQILPYRISGGFISQDGILRTDNMKRGTIAANFSPSFFDNHLNINANIKGTYTHSRFGNGDAIGAALRMDPTKPVTEDGFDAFRGYWAWTNDAAHTSLNTMATRNPVALLYGREDIGDVMRSIGNVQADYRFFFLPELRANLNLGYDISNGRGENAVADWSPQNYPQGHRNKYDQTKINTLLEFYLNYTKQLDENNRLEVMAGYTWQDWKLKDKSFPTWFYDGTIDSEAPIIIPPHNRLISFFGRANYNLMERYLLTATVRYDGSSRFSPEHRWGLFPSLAAAWRINQEDFMKGFSAISNLKLRIGYGITGQQDLNSDFGWLSIYELADQTAQVQFGDSYFAGWRPNGYDSNRKWEQTATTNIGIDFGFLNDRYYGSIDIYQKHTTDLLNEVPVPAGSNFTPYIIRNIGTMDNWGVELALGTVIIDTRDMRWSIDFNATWNRTKISKLSLNDGPDSDYKGIFVGTISGGTGNTVQIHSVGHSPNSFYVYKQMYDEAGKPIEGVYADLNGDGVVNDNDLYIFHKPAPDWYLGFQTSFSYKNWSLATALRASIGNWVYNNVNSDMGNFSQTLNPNSFLMNNVVDGLKSGFVNRQLLSDYYIQDAAFLKMDYIQLGYDFGKIIAGKIGLKATFTIQNVFTLTKYDGIDPEMSSGIDSNYYPIPRTFMLGLALNF